MKRDIIIITLSILVVGLALIIMKINPEWCFKCPRKSRVKKSEMEMVYNRYESLRENLFLQTKLCGLSIDPNIILHNRDKEKFMISDIADNHSIFF